VFTHWCSYDYNWRKKKASIAQLCVSINVERRSFFLMDSLASVRLFAFGIGSVALCFGSVFSFPRPLPMMPLTFLYSHEHPTVIVVNTSAKQSSNCQRFRPFPQEFMAQDKYVVNGFQMKNPAPISCCSVNLLARFLTFLTRLERHEFRSRSRCLA
jgi:hypothetical protein